MQTRPDLMTALGDIGESTRALIMEDPFLTAVKPPYLRQAVTAYTQRGGKMLRPALCQWSCGVVGGDPYKARYIAAATEMFHTWTLVHDDIIDEDDTRRGGPSAHRLLEQLGPEALPGMAAERASRFGINMSILTGDVQQAFANVLVGRALADGVSAPVVLSILARMNGALNPGLIGGEAADVAFEDQPFETITTADMMGMYRDKTGLLLRFAAEAGAQVGSDCSQLTSPQLQALGRFAEQAGLAFQLQDDILGMFGDEKAVGKPGGSDLRKGKRTVLFAAALERLAPKGAAVLHACLGEPELADDKVEQAAEAIDACGALAWVRDQAQALAEDARRELASLPANHYRNLLDQWVTFVCQRTW